MTDANQQTGGSSAEDDKGTGIYERAPTSAPLQQGDILTGLVHWIFVEADEQGVPLFDEQPYPFALVLSQSCDLEWDYNERKNGQTESDKCLSCILLAPAFPATEVRARKGDGLINSDKWKRIRSNNEERFHFFETVPPIEDSQRQGLPELVVDFKRYFALSAPELYRQIGSKAHCRVRLRSPYLEHAATRFFYFQSRIATPRPHFSNP